jgi:RNA polymerase sigma-70 factor, ECF subfamily
MHGVTSTKISQSQGLAGTNRRFAELVEKVRLGTGLEELYAVAKGFSFFLLRQLGRDELQDKVHDIFVATAQAIRRGKLRDPERLIPFVTKVTRFYTYSQIERRTQSRRLQGPLEHANVPDDRVNLERTAYQKQKVRIVHDILHSMNERDCDVLRRFYIQEQSKEQICEEMRLTNTQFRLLKSRAKSRFAKLGAVKLRQSSNAA